MVRLRRCRDLFQPRERRHSDGGIDSKQLVELSDLLGGDRGEQSIRGTFAGAGAPSNGGALEHRRCREKDLLGAKGSDGAGNDRRTSVGAPGGCAAASIIKGRSAAVGSRIPNIAAKARPWSVIVWDRRAYSVNAVAGISSCTASQATRPSTGSSICARTTPG